MVNDHYPYWMAISLGIYPIFRQTHLNAKMQLDSPDFTRWLQMPFSSVPVAGRSCSAGCNRGCQRWERLAFWAHYWAEHHWQRLAARYFLEHMEQLYLAILNLPQPNFFICLRPKQMTKNSISKMLLMWHDAPIPSSQATLRVSTATRKRRRKTKVSPLRWVLELDRWMVHTTHFWYIWG